MWSGMVILVRPFARCLQSTAGGQLALRLVWLVAGGGWQLQMADVAQSHMG